MPRTMFDKIWDAHVVVRKGENEALLHVDRNYIHEGSFHAFSALEREGRTVRKPRQTFAVADHYTPTVGRERGIAGVDDAEAKHLIENLERNAKAAGILHYGIDDRENGIVHVVWPEQGVTQPGLVITCGDSHTSTHGAMGAFAFGVGASQLKQVLATQCIWQKKPKTLRILVDGKLPYRVSAKDIILAVIAKIGIGGAQGYCIEYAGSAIRQLDMEARMTVCNMSIEAGGRAGMVAPDPTTFAYLKGRPYAPKGEQWDKAVEYWRTLPSDEGATFDKEVGLDAAKLAPMVTWGTNPEEAAPIDAVIPDPAKAQADKRGHMEQALMYIGLRPGQPIAGLKIDRVFIGSCTNSRITDLRVAAEIARGRKAVIPAIVSPGSREVKRQAEAEGLDRVFTEAGFEWRDSGCSMCVGINGDQVPAGLRSASTSNRNFEGRQGKGARTHLVSPAMAAAAAVFGKLVDVRTI